MRVDDETSAPIFEDGGSALKDDKVDIGQMKGVRGCKPYRASAYDYGFEWVVWAAYFGAWIC
jgi:hypothetical protein